MRFYPTIATVSFFALLFANCGPIDPPPEDDKGEEIPLPQPFDTFLELEKVKPESDEVGLRPVLWIQFSDYLDDDKWIDRSAVSLVSGGLVHRGRITNVFSQKAILFTPNDDLIEGFKYTLKLSKKQFKSFNDAPLETPKEIEFTVNAKLSDQGVPLPDPFWPEIKAIFSKKCDSCHSDPNWGLIELEFDTLIGIRSEQVDRFLVKPLDSSDSYLMHKILPDFDERKFTVQPPPWSDGLPLTAEEILKIDQWIEKGARP